MEILYLSFHYVQCSCVYRKCNHKLCNFNTRKNRGDMRTMKIFIFSSLRVFPKFFHSRNRSKANRFSIVNIDTRSPFSFSFSFSHEICENFLLSLSTDDDSQTATDAIDSTELQKISRNEPENVFDVKNFLFSIFIFISLSHEFVSWILFSSCLLFVYHFCTTLRVTDIFFESNFPHASVPRQCCWC